MFCFPDPTTSYEDFVPCCICTFALIFCKCFNPFIYRSVVIKKDKCTECCFPMLHIEGNEGSSAFFILHKTMKIDLTARKK